jgi:pseudouridine synthase
VKRLNKYISDTGYCSRREADALIEAKKVLVNGRPPLLGTKITDTDKVTINGQLIKPVAQNKSDRVYIAYHKPVGITCTTERKIKGNIVDAINFPQRIFPIGRLDKPSEGLILLTNDGDIVNKILRAENAHDKLYRVTVNKAITDDFIQKMSQGVPILDTVTMPCEVKQVGKCSFDIVLQQGLNRQIRRMCEYLHYDVVKLIRKRIMHIELRGIAPGQYRHLSQTEMALMNDALQGSSKVASQKQDNTGTKEHNPRKSKPTLKREDKPKIQVINPRKSKNKLSLLNKSRSEKANYAPENKAPENKAPEKQSLIKQSPNKKDK